MSLPLIKRRGKVVNPIESKAFICLCKKEPVKKKKACKTCCLKTPIQKIFYQLSPLEMEGIVEDARPEIKHFFGDFTNFEESINDRPFNVPRVSVHDRMVKRL